MNPSKPQNNHSQQPNNHNNQTTMRQKKGVAHAHGGQLHGAAQVQLRRHEEHGRAVRGWIVIG
jgi:hypothetical protein